MRDFLTVVALVSTVFGIVFGAADLFTARSCSNYSEETDIETKYRHFDACYLKTPQGWMPWSEFKARAMAKEAAK